MQLVEAAPRPTRSLQAWSATASARADVVYVAICAVPLLYAIGERGSAISYTSAHRILLALVLAMVPVAVWVAWGALRHMRSGQAAAFGGLAIWYVYPAALNMFHPSTDLESLYLELSPASLVHAALLVCTCLAAMAATWWLSHEVLRERRSLRPPRPTRSERLFPFALSAVALGLAPYFVFGSGVAGTLALILQGRTEKPWLQFGNLGDARSPFTNAAVFALMAGGTLCWCIAADRGARRRHRVVSGLVALSATLLVLVDQGTRTNLVFMCAPAAGAWLYGRIAARGRVPWLRLAAIAAVAIGALQVQLIYRAAWTRGRWQSRLFQEWFTLGDTIDQFRETAFAVKVVPSAHPFFHESVLFQFLASPIPRVLWPGKPVSQVVRFFTLERWNIDVLTDAGNVFPGILGQFYMSWGASGVVAIAALFAFGAALVDRGVRRNAGSDHYATAIWLMAATFLVLSFRVLAPAPGYPIVLCWILVALARARWRRAGAQ